MSKMMFGYGSTLIATGQHETTEGTVYFIAFRDTGQEHEIGPVKDPSEPDAWSADPYLNSSDVFFAFTTAEQRDRVFASFNNLTDVS